MQTVLFLKEEEKDKLDKLISIIKEFSYEDIFYIEKNLDKQFIALKRLYDNLKDAKTFFELVLINSLLSYYLPMKGEDYWQKFSEFFSKNKLNKKEAFKEFIVKNNYRLLNQKLKRLNKILDFLEKNNFSLEDYDYFINNPLDFLEILSKGLNQDKNSKTLVFAIKMLNYAYMIVKGENHKLKKGIMIPLDSRLKKISSNLSFWLELEKKIPFSLLHLDSIIWVTLGLSKEEIDNIKNQELKRKLKKLKELLTSFEQKVNNNTKNKNKK